MSCQISLRKCIIFLLCLSCAGGIFISCHKPQYVELTGSVWNTVYNIKYNGNPAIADSVTDIMRDIEMSLSPFNPRSVISRINYNLTDTVDNHIKNIFALSQKISRDSNGAFDPTLSPLINLWGFGYEGKDGKEPTFEEISQALSKVGIDECALIGNRLMKKHPETTFNFSAVTKGYGCDEIAKMFKRNGVKNYMIEIGGEIALGGVNDRGRPWRIMVETPRDSLVRTNSGVKTIALSNCGIATSGNYRNYRDTSAGRVGHTINRHTGYPVASSTLSATVIAPSCAEADALATACMVMPSDSALAMITSLDSIECLLIVTDSFDAGFNLVFSPSFPF